MRVEEQRVCWELVRRLSETLVEAGEPLYSLNYMLSTKSLIKNFLTELKVPRHHCLKLPYNRLYHDIH